MPMRLILLITLLVVATGGLQAQNSAKSWQPPKVLLASTSERRRSAAQRLGIAKGEYVVALLSIRCGDCDREALGLNEKASADRIIAIAPAPAKDVATWKKKLGLKYRVVAVSDKVFDDFGGVILPTLVLLRDGRAVGVSERAEVVE
ncbi:MAG: peroxiredoxin family protein [Acidobacteriota bacterium]|nr:peroxiredoxin family protein [Acidobacteriota bacterium]